MLFRQKRLLAAVLCLVALFSAAFISFRPQKAYALTANDVKKATLTWVNRATIRAQVGDQTLTFFDTNIGDKTHRYEVQGYECPGKIDLDSKFNKENPTLSFDPEPSRGRLDLDFLPPQGTTGGPSCEDVGGRGKFIEKSIGSVPNSEIIYAYTSNTTIARVDGSGDDYRGIDESFTVSPQSPQVFIGTNEPNGECKNLLRVNGSSGVFYDLSSQVTGRSGEKLDPAPKELGALNCYVLSQRDMRIGGSATNPIPTPGSDPSGTDIPGGDNAPTCESSGATLNWILCPVFNGVANLSDWLFANLVEPLLQASPVSTDPNEGTYKIWSSFRVFGNIILIIAMLVIVFGQSIGGGLIDAYTAKKVLPRILTAAILINLSVYIVALLVDITNVIGAGLGDLMTAPLEGSGQFEFSPSGIQILGIVGGGATAGIISVFLSGVLFVAGAGTLGTAAVFIGLFVLLPAIIGLIGAFVTLVIRQGLILFLVLVSPVAFALYCLPSTEKYFKKWWELLVKTLAVYPIIIAIFAMADIMTVTIMKANGVDDGPLLSQTAESFSSVLAAIVAFVVQFLPLMLIPFAFKFAGGVIGTLYTTLSGFGKKGEEAIKGNPNDPNSFRNRTRHNFGAMFSRGKAQQYRTLRDGNRHRLASMMGNALEKEALLNEASKKRIFTVKDNGDDSIVNARASFIDPVDGKRKTLDGKEVKKADWLQAKKFLPNFSDIQAVADYRSTKINSTQEALDYVNRFGLMAKQNGLTLDETVGAFTATSFARQNERGEWKHGKWSIGADGSYQFSPVGASHPNGAKSYVHEQYYKKGSFDASRAFASQFQSMGEVKQMHLDNVRGGGGLEVKDSAGNVTETISADASREELRKILETEKAWEGNSGMRDPETGEIMSGITGASAGTRAAFDKMKATGYARAEDAAVLQGLRAEIESGQTWEALNSPGGPPAGSPPQGGSGPAGRAGGGGIIIPPSGYTGSQG